MSAATVIVYVSSPDGVKIAVYVVPDPPKSDNVPPLTVISPTTKLAIVSFDVKVNDIIESLDVSPVDTVDEVISIVGLVPSYVQEKVFETVLLFPYASVNVSAATLIVQAPSVVGVNVALYVVPEPEKLDNEPFETVISPTTKLVVVSLDVNTIAIVASLDVSPLDTVDEVIVIVGDVPSYVQEKLLDALLLLPLASVNVEAPTLIVQAPSVVGVNVALYVVPEPEKLDKAPFVTDTSPTTKLVVASLDVNTIAIVASFDVSPLVTVDEVIVIVGDVVSHIQVNVFETVLLFP